MSYCFTKTDLSEKAQEGVAELLVVIPPNYGRSIQACLGFGHSIFPIEEDYVGPRCYFSIPPKVIG